MRNSVSFAVAVLVAVPFGFVLDTLLLPPSWSVACSFGAAVLAHYWAFDQTFVRRLALRLGRLWRRTGHNRSRRRVGAAVRPNVAIWGIYATIAAGLCLELTTAANPSVANPPSYGAQAASAGAVALSSLASYAEAGAATTVIRAVEASAAGFQRSPVTSAAVVIVRPQMRVPAYVPAQETDSNVPCNRGKDCAERHTVAVPRNKKRL